MESPVSTTLSNVTSGATVRFERDKLFIGGEWVEPASQSRIDLVDPATGEVIGSVPRATEPDVDRAVRCAVEEFRSGSWRDLSYADRAAHLARLADEIEVRADEIATVYAHDFGGLRRIGRALAVRSALLLRTHADYVERLPQEPERRLLGGVEALVIHEPVGPVLGIVPWNSTLPITIIKLASALLAGCPIVIKIAAESPLNSFLIGDALEAAEIPRGLVSLLPADPESLGNITGRPEFRHVSFTGSTAAGIGIMKQAAENVTRVTMELGGKSPAIILDDFDPSEAAALYGGTMGQAGQVCTTYSRLLVPRSREQEWRAALTDFYSGLTVGDPVDDRTEVGPLLTARHWERVAGFVESARQDGATVLTGGGRPAHLSGGFYFEPTLIADVTQEMQIVRDEVFGPVITLQAYDTIDDAVALANDTDFGLAAGIFTHDRAKALAISARLDAGAVSINAAGACTFMPFGGYKKSGLGREGGLEGVLALLEIKQIQLGPA
jgi:aldehyde dehydrogenase (NAD+)